MPKAKRRIVQPSDHSKKKHFSLFTAVIVLFLVIYSLALITLLVWAFITSFKDNALDFGVNPIGLPSKWVFTNYDIALNNFQIQISLADGSTGYVKMPVMFLYGFLYALGCSFANTIVPCIVGYLCAKFKYKFSKLIYLIVIIAMILPIVGNLPAEIATARAFGLYDQIWGMWIMKANFLGLYFLVFYNFFKNLPNAYGEAAKIDGAGNFRILFRIILPLAVPIFSTIMLINFITYWNDYQTPLIYLQTYPTIALGMYRIGHENLPGVAIPPVKMAAALLVLAPVLVIFLIFHKKLLGNITMGGIKG